MGESVHSARPDDLDSEIRELEASISATRAHGILYYSLLVVIVFLGFAIGFATHTVVGVLLIVVGLALVAWREIWHFNQHATAIGVLIDSKRRERAAMEQGEREVDSKG